MMPKLDGFGVYHELQKNPQTQKIPVIFLTALGEEQEELKELRPTAVIFKPFFPRQILNTVNSLLENTLSKKQPVYSKTTGKKKQVDSKKLPKLTKLGEVIAGIIHDLTNEFEIIDNTVNYPLSNIEKSNPNTTEIDVIARRANHCKKLLSNISDLSFRDKSDFAEIDVHRVLKSKLGKSTDKIAHTLTNELEVIDKAINYLASNIDQNNPNAKEIRVITRSVNYSKILLNNLLEVVSQEKSNITEVDVHKVLKEVLLLIKYRVPSNVKLTKTLKSSLSLVLADKDQLKQVFMNIINNAIQAMPMGGKLKVLSRVIEYFPEAKFICIEFSDTGVGISEDNLSKIFDLSFTTKRKSYGLGLYISRGIVNRHGGVMRVMSEEGKGTTFMVELPIKGSEKYGR